MPVTSSEPSLHARDGQRKYLTPSERARFIAVADAHARAELGTFGLLLAYSGCRISEALALRPRSFDLAEGNVAIRSLKKRRADVFREVPLPPQFLARLNAVHGLDAADPDTRLWPWCRAHAWTLLKSLMAEADITGCQATAKGLRHGLAVHAIRSGVPLHLIQRWLGHSSLSTTSIYTQVMGAEEREIASRMWP